jgi:hypothetical protein
MKRRCGVIYLALGDPALQRSNEMTKRNRKTTKIDTTTEQLPSDFAERRLIEEAGNEPEISPLIPNAPGDNVDVSDDGEAEASVSLPRSVVRPGYKQRYIERAEALQRKPMGVSMKALKRMTGDWLAIELAKLTLDPKSKLVVASFEAVLAANGVKYDHWNRTSKGWQGRFRMTGRLALQRVVAEAGELAVPNGAAIAAPRSWVAKFA